MESKNIYIYGAGNRGIELLDLIQEKYRETVEIIGFIDAQKSGFIKTYKIFGVDEIPKDSIIVVSIFNFEMVHSVVMELKKKKYKNIFWFNVKNERKVTKNFFLEQCSDCKGWEEDTLVHVEMHAMDACNLNCIGCTHFSPLFDMEKPNINVIKNDLYLLRNKISSIVNFCILGGEPLLNDDLIDYIELVKLLYPKSLISVVTNGLLIPNCSSELLEYMSENNICFSISEYRPTHKMINKIIDVLNTHNIIYNIRAFDQKQKFNKPLSLIKKYEKYCISKDCINIANGKIARCPTLLYIYKLNEKFGTKFPEEGVINLSTDISGSDLKRKLYMSVPLCEYCIKNEIEWSICGKNPSEKDFIKI